VATDLIESPLGGSTAAPRVASGVSLLASIVWLVLGLFLAFLTAPGPIFGAPAPIFDEIQASRRQKGRSMGFYAAPRSGSTKVLPLFGDFWALLGTRQEARNRPKIDLWRKRRSQRRRSYRLLALFCHALLFCSNSDQFLTKIRCFFGAVVATSCGLISNLATLTIVCIL